MKQGKLYFIKFNTLYALIIVLIIAGCNKQQQSVAPPPEIPVVNIQRQDIPVYSDFVGQVYGFQDIVINARVEGFLDAIHFNEGTKVTKGQLLYTIDPQQYQARVAAQMSGVVEAKTNLVKANSDLNRIRPLAENNAVSKSDLDAAVAHYEAAQAGLEAAKANLESARIELSYTKIKSPINGIIGKTQAKVGDFVGRSPNPVVLNEVSNIETVLVEFFLTEAEYLTIAKEVIEKEGRIQKRSSGEKAKIKMILADGMEYPYVGEINFIDRQVNSSTGSILLQASFPNPDKLVRPGQFARVVVEMNILKNAMIVPQVAVNEVQGAFNVFVVKDDSQVQLLPIKVETTYGDFYVIKSGLTGNEKIVVEGLQKIRPGMMVKPVETKYQSKSTKTK